MVMGSMVLVYMGVLTLLDAKKRELPLKVLAVGTVLAVSAAACRLLRGEGTWMELFLGAIPGMILLNLAWLTKSTGIGDGIVLLQLNLCMFAEKMVVAFGVSLLAIGAFALLILLVKRGSRGLRLPYMPFLWIGCLASWLLCG